MSANLLNSVSSVQFSHSVQFSSVAQSCPATLPMNHSTPGLPVHYQLLESTQNHVHHVSDAHPMILSSVIPFSSHFQSFPAPGSFPMSQFFTSGGQSIGASASASVLPMSIQDFLQDSLVGSPCSPRNSQQSSPIPQFKSINSLVLSFLYSLMVTSIHDHWKNHSLDQMDLCWRSNVLNMLSRLVITFLPRSKRLLISYITVILFLNFTILYWFCQISK